ncbi:DEAD/DEAH box helicase family protein [Priestia aryabhattai]|uniref:restriction endonuclease n=1 Tax=Priestia aryabhattai TaxID=412384 RepID=UPI003D26AD72
MTLKLKFDSNLQYQKDAIESVTQLFTGQSIRQTDFSVITSYDSGLLKGTIQTENGVGNRLDLTTEQLLKNLQVVQEKNHLPLSSSLNRGDMHFTIEMETGTGKTYVYLRTIFELNKLYGFTKFLIVVPSVAIREGVLKSIQIMKNHFQNLYEHQPFTEFVYDSQKLEQVQSFTTDSHIQIMIINIDAFRKSFKDPNKEDKANIIHRPQDRLSGQKPIELIQQTNPFVIIDEPQSVDSTEKSKEAIASLNPLCTLRYSATHVDRHEMIYKLDAIDAYNQGLVKKIEVTSLMSEESFNRPYLHCIGFIGKKVKIEVDIIEKGIVKRKKINVGIGDDLEDLTGRSMYQGYIVSQIDYDQEEGYIEFGNDVRLEKGVKVDVIHTDEFKRLMIERTIVEHFEKELRFLRSKEEIKVLSLFFIDRVDYYRLYKEDGIVEDGKYALWFMESYERLLNQERYKPLKKMYGAHPLNKIHQGYFSKDKSKQWKDTKGNTVADEETYSLIMRNKERLLSFDEPCRFIFSHSALREGWDNPNVFQICTLNETHSEVKKRQEIGRGLRICVDQQGNRKDKKEHEHLNILTVMANESYESFVESLQVELLDDVSLNSYDNSISYFAGIATKDASGELESMGSHNAEELITYLMEKNYLELKKRTKALSFKKQLVEDLNNNYSFELPEKFNKWSKEIIYHLEKATQHIHINDATKRRIIKVNKPIIESTEFGELWKRINQKTIYRVNFDSEKLVKNCIDSLNNNNSVCMKPIKVTAEKYKIEMEHVSGVTGKAANSAKYEIGDIIVYPIPDLVTELQNYTQLTRRTIVRILTGLSEGILESIKYNPQKFLQKVTEIIQQQKRDLMVDGIYYEKINDYYKIDLLRNDEEIGYTGKYTVESKKSLHNYIVCDSGVEEEFAYALDADERVKVFAKLPGWFKIDTPLGNYNPDWAVVIDKENGNEELYFIIETKGSTEEDDLRRKELLKISFAKRHFQVIGQGLKFCGPVKEFNNFIKEEVLN